MKLMKKKRKNPGNRANMRLIVKSQYNEFWNEQGVGNNDLFKHELMDGYKYYDGSLYAKI